jgi:hypothetical protein
MAVLQYLEFTHSLLNTRGDRLVAATGSKIVLLSMEAWDLDLA